MSQVDPKPKSIAGSLFALVLVAVVPLLVFGSVVSWWIVEHKRADVAAELAGSARSLRSNLDRELAGQFAAMNVLAGDTSLDGPVVRDYFEQEARRAVESQPAWLGLALFDAVGRPVGRGRHAELAADRLSPALAVLRANPKPLATLLPARSAETGPTVLLLAPAIRGEELRYAVAVAMEPSQFGTLFGAQQIGAAWSGSVLDAELNVVSRSGAPATAREPLAARLRERLASAERGMFEAVDAAGKRFYTVFERSPATGWTLALDVPAAEVEGPVGALLAKLAFAALALLGFALALAVRVGRGIVRARDAHENSLREGRERLQVSLGEYADLLNRIPVGVYKLRLLHGGGYRFDFTSARWCEQLGVDAAAVAADPHCVFERTHPDDREDFRAANAAARRARQPFAAEVRILRGGEVRWLRLHALPVLLDNGDVVWEGIQSDVTEPKRAEEALAVSELRYRVLFETANDGLFLADATGFIDCNERGAAMYGRARNEVLGRSPVDFSPERQPDGRLSAEIANEKIGLALQGRPCLFEWRSLRADGTPFDVEITLNRIDVGGAPCVQAIVRDITERKRAERALQEAHDRFARLAAQVPGVLFQYRIFPDGRSCVPYASQGLQEMYEVDPEEVREDSMPALERAHPDDHAAFIESIERAVRTLLPWRHEYRVVLPRQGMRWRLGHAQPEPLSDGSILFHGFITDITERKAAEARDQVLVSALEAVGNGIVITDGHACVEWANSAFESLTGYTREEALGRRPSELVKSGMQEASFYEAMWRTILAGRQWRGELVNKRKDGSFYHEELVIAPVKDSAGTIHHFVAIKHDISARKHLEAELREMATTDLLTGLPNRRHFMARLEEELARILRLEHQRAAVLMIDLDHFKRINDKHGHAVGDAMLSHFAALMREGLRKIDTGARIGGEEFAIILPGADIHAAGIFAERLRHKAETTPLMQNGHAVPLTVSIGIAAIQAGDASPDAALIRADEALYRAKVRGRNCVDVSA